MIFKKKLTLEENLIIEDLGNPPKFPGKITVVDAPFYSFSKHGVTQSFLSEFLACRKRAHLSYREGWSSATTSNVMTFGHLFHGCLEKYYRYLKLSFKPEAINIAGIVEGVLKTHKEETMKEKVWSSQDEEDFILNTGYLKILFPKYLEVYAKRDRKYKWALVEGEFNNIYNGVRLRGKFDRVAVNNIGETWVFETKTKGRIEPEIQTRLSFDLQVMMYILNYQLRYKIIPSGFIYDVIKRPALRKGKSETLKHFMDRVRGDVDESYFMRIQMRLDSKEFGVWKKEFDQILEEFKEWIAGKLPTYRNVASCETRYGSCKMVRVCGLGDYTGLVKRKSPMPELEKI